MKKRSWLLCLLSAVFIAGCGENAFKGQEDKNSTEAQQFDISASLDSGDYQAVLNDPNANATDYAAAAMGEAGLDPVSLIQAMNTVATDPTIDENDLGPVTSIVLDPAALDELQTAKDKLATELAANPTDPDLNFQMTLTSLTSTLTALAQVGVENNVAGFDPSGGISPTEANILATYITTNPTAQVDTDGDGVLDTSLVTIIAEDVVNIVNTLPNANLGTGSDLNTVLTDATQGAGSINYEADDGDANGDGLEDVSADDISKYLKLVLGQ